MFRFVPGCFLQIHSLVQSVLVLLSCLLMANHCNDTTQEDVFRGGPARFFVLSGGSQPVFVSNDGITCSLNCLEVSRDFCNAFSAAVA